VVLSTFTVCCSSLLSVYSRICIVKSSNAIAIRCRPPGSGGPAETHVGYPEWSTRASTDRKATTSSRKPSLHSLTSNDRAEIKPVLTAAALISTEALEVFEEIFFLMFFSMWPCR
jgi:hypothetical protein